MMRSTLKEINSIRLHEVEFAYPSQRPLFQKMTLALPMNNVVRIRGGSGQGKSALLRLLAGLIQPQAGAIYFNDDDITQFSFEEFLTYRFNIGYSFDFGGLLSNKTIFENLALGLEYHKVMKRKEIRGVVKEVLEFFGLTGQAGLRPSAISGSQRKAAVVARALIRRPRVLLLDDPTTGLGPETKEALVDFIKAGRKAGHFQHVFVATDDRPFLNNLSVTEVQLDKFCQGPLPTGLNPVKGGAA